MKFEKTRLDKQMTHLDGEYEQGVWASALPCLTFRLVFLQKRYNDWAGAMSVQQIRV